MTKRIASLCCFAAAAYVLGEDFEITRSTIDSGGLMRSTGGDFELSSTIGQHDAGVLHGGDLTLEGGFWFALSPADCDEDGAVSLLDHQLLVECFTGPNIERLSGCVCLDIDRSGFVDLRDFAIAQRTHSRSD